MRIIELNISEFGGLKNLKITFDEKLNIIYGENESGKSTILLFIKFMLYGLGRKSSANIERERSISWEGGVAAGSMSFSHGGKNYRIERRYVDGGRESKTLRCLDDGSEIRTDKTVGEYFLGVPKEVFESSACVGQMRSADINGEKTAASIQNMLTTADESVDATKILKELDAVRVTYRHKNKNGGSLYEREQEIHDLKQRLDAARDAAGDIAGVAEKIDALNGEISVVVSDLEATDSLLSQINKIAILERFKALKDKRKQLEDLEHRKKGLCADALKTEFFPDNKFLAELKYSADALDESSRLLEDKRATLKQASDKNYDEKLADIGERIENDGGVGAILQAIEEKKSGAKRQANGTFALWAASAVFAVAAIALIVLGHIWGAVFFLPMPVTSAFAMVKNKNKEKTYNEIEELAARYSFTPEDIAVGANECMAQLSRKRSYTVLTASANAELNELQKSFDRHSSRLAALIGKIAPSLFPSVENSRAEYDRIERFLNEYNSLCAESSSLDGIIFEEERELDIYDEQSIRSEVTVDIEEVEKLAVFEAESRRRFLTSKKNSLDSKLYELNSQLINLKAKAEDPLPIGDEIAELEKKQASEEKFYLALTLAMDSIEKAGEVMSGSVIPAISIEASEIMERISDSRYTALRATGTLDLSLDRSGFGIKSDFLSGGTRDAAYLSLRIALFKHIYGENVPPLILDEALCQLDDIRTEKMLTILSLLADEGAQVLTFTSHERDEKICSKNSLAYFLITL